MVYPAKLSVSTIAAAALEVVDKQGIASLGMRPVADRLAVRPASLYKHCGDLLGLQGLVAEAVATELLARAREAVGTLGDSTGASMAPADAMMALARVYADYADEQPARYAVLTLDTSGSAMGARQPQAARKALWEFLLEVVSAQTGSPDDTAAAVALWSFLHGFVSLRAAGAFGPSGPHDALARGLRALTQAL
jgi:AcrR family transcriptional regulator